MPSPSPTTTRAVKLNRRPPFTTLATRLIATTRSRCGVFSTGALLRPPPSRRLSRRLPPSEPPDPPPLRCCPGIRRLPSPRTRVRPRARHRPGRRCAPRTGFRHDRRPPCRYRPPSPARRATSPPGERPPSCHPRYRGWTGPWTTPRPPCAPSPCRCGAARPCCRSFDASTVWLSLLPCLSGLAPDDLALVLHALALVRLRRANLTDVRGDLAHELLVDTGHVEQGRPLDGEGDPGRRCHDNRVREAERELQVGSLRLDPVPGAGDLQGLAVPLGHPEHHVRHQRAGQPVQLLGPALVVGTGHVEVAVVAPLRRDGLGERVGELTLGPLDGHRPALDRHVDAGRYGDRLTSDSRHGRSSSPDVGEDFPAYPSPAGLPVGQQPLRRRNDGDAEAAEHARQVGRLGVHPKPGF